MLYYLYEQLIEVYSPIRVFKYITVRSGGAAVIALIVSMVIGPYMIRWLYRLRIGQEIRKDECPPLHLIHKNKQGTPTIGGLLIIASVTISTLVFARWDNPYIWLVLAVFLALGVVGFVDDYLKVKHRQSLGLRPKSKLLFQAIIGIVLAIGLFWVDKEFPLYVPFYKYPVIENMGYVFILLSMLVIIGASNAVNLTDGLDGLAIGTTTVCILAYTILAYLVGNFKTADYLYIFYVPNAAELTVFCAALVGASLGFLWFNAHPAMVFMGDTGSLALGGAIGAVALMIRKEILLLIIGGVFVMEALSVILQVGSFRVRSGRRIFRMAPIHHHYEMKGWPETRVTIRFWIIALIFAIIGLATLKLQ